ncbi:MAG: HAMP domain-containing protein [Chloroflexi bacterium]|nr:HAMP domain-containing protein [Chloroflexota bacterium]
MVRDQESEKRPGWLQSLRRLPTLGIRSKIVLPYLILTLIVAIVGTYVVTTLVASSLDERLTNQLLDAGRTVSDSLVQQELDHIASARAVAFTVGLAEALEAGDRGSVATLARPVAAVQGVECLILFDVSSQGVLHVLERDDGSFEIVEEPLDASGLEMVQGLLDSGDPNELPRRGLGQHLADGRYYYFTAVPVGLENKVVGVVVVGTSLDTLLPYFKRTSLADVTIYGNGGRVIATTFALAEQPADIDVDLYERVLRNTDFTLGENFRISGRWYRVARGALRVGNESLGAFAVALPWDFIVQASADSRNTYTVIFVVATACVIAVGYVISQRITNPINHLVRASRAVAEGRLDQRTGIVSADEIGMLATTFDEMTSRLQERTQKLEETIGRMRAILSSIGDGVLLEDLEGRFVPLNAAAETLLEEMAAHFLLGPLREPPAGGYDEASDAQLNPWLLERRQIEVGQKVIRAYSAAVRADDGERLGTVIVLRDVTAEVEAEQLKDAFVTHVSHELRTPLTAIKGYSELLLANSAGALGEEQRGFLETINRHTDSLVRMINSLLDFSEMEARGRLALLQRPLLLSTLVEEIADEWRSLMEEKELEFEVKAPADLPLVSVDTKRLRWAIINLVRNAWQHTPAGGSVGLHLSGRDGQVVLDVTDTGSGIPPEDQQRIFNRFYSVTQVAQDSDSDVRGLGIGLYVAKVIVEAHGGEISLVSGGTGSKFSVILPALADRESEQGTA